MTRRYLFTGLLVLLLLVFQVSASSPHIITVTGGGSTLPISSTNVNARTVNIFAPTGNAGTVRIGDSTASSTVGQPLAAGAAFFFPPIADSMYSLNLIYAYVANGDTAIIIWTD